MDDKIKRLLKTLALLEEVAIRLISLIGWILILIKVIEG
jgi:hypothetical protein